jgi:hypothetical protein
MLKYSIMNFYLLIYLFQIIENQDVVKHFNFDIFTLWFV